MEEGPFLEEINYKFTQEGNTNGTTNKFEELTITIESVNESLTKSAGFLVIRTSTGWSVDDPEEFLDLLNFVMKYNT